jgi:hypothetical protein
MGVGEEDGAFVKGQNKHKNATRAFEFPGIFNPARYSVVFVSTCSVPEDSDKGIEMKFRLTRQV